jgi:L-malate glycosyltransferase
VTFCSTPLQVVHILEPEPAGEIGGADMHVLQLSAAQRARGAVAPFVVINQNRLFFERLVAAGIDTFEGHRLRGAKFRTALALADLPERRSISLVHSHDYDANYLTYLLYTMFPGRWAGIPLVMTCHGWVESCWRHRFKTVLDFITYRIADALIICSRHQRKRVSARYPHKPVFYVPNGVEMDPSPGPPSAAARVVIDAAARGGPVIGYVGRLSREKRLDLLLKSFARTRELIGAGRLIVAGSGRELESSRRLARELSLADVVTFAGLVPDIAHVYPRLDLLFLTSETEATSRVAIEAMMQGVPVIASNVGGLPDLIRSGETGVLCPYGDIEAFARAAEYLIRNPVFRHRLIEQARDAARGFTIEQMELEVSQVYRKVLDRRRP